MHYLYHSDETRRASAHYNDIYSCKAASNSVDGHFAMAPDGHDGRLNVRTNGRTWRKLYPSAFGRG